MIIGLAAAAMATLPHARSGREASGGPLPATVVVLDMSTSIGSLAYPQVARTLETIARAGGERRVGLIAFSDSAYVALPPTVPPRELEPYARYYQRAGRHYPVNPWSQNFSGGTVISSGLALARGAVHQARIPHAVVVLISDLADVPDDFDALQAQVAAYARDPTVTLRVVPLPPSVRSDWARGLIGQAHVVSADSPAVVTGPARRASGWDYLVVVLATGLALAANELICAKLRWRVPVVVAGAAEAA
jgi:hypothetical protein